MDQQTFQTAKAAYQAGDVTKVASLLSPFFTAGTINAEAAHLLGNSFMQLSRFDDAAKAYTVALRDTSYGKIGALSCNKGRALMAANRPDDAIAAFQAALADPTYATPYKAYMALGTILLEKGSSRDAGVAFRNAAIDEANPDPAVALSRLGRCFMELARPLDAVEAFRTALDFSTSPENQNAVYAELGRAYVAANRMPEALDAFGHALSDGTYTLAPEAQIAYQAAQRAVEAIAQGPSSTDAFLVAMQRKGSGAFGESGSFDPLSPTGTGDVHMPSPEDTGFFSVTEEELVEQGGYGKSDFSPKRKRHRVGLRIAIAVALVFVLALAGGAFAYYKGYGLPSQEDVIASFFKARTDGSDIGSYLAGSVSSAVRAQIQANVPAGAVPKVTGIDRSMSLSTVRVVATLSEGGSQSYVITMTRDMLSWKIAKVEAVYASAGETPASSPPKTEAAGTPPATPPAASPATPPAAPPATPPPAPPAASAQF